MQTPDEDRLDLWLDEALRQHGNIMPRDGMEARLLAKLRSREERTRAICKWALAFGSPLLTVLLIVLVWRGERPNVHPANSNASNGTAHSTPVEQASGKLPLPLPGARDVKIARTNRRHVSLQALLSEPRLDHFPSVRPPSAEELVLAQYAERYPQEATLAAKKQEEFEVAVEKAQQESEAQARISNE